MRATCVCEINSDTRRLINFIAGFTESEWEMLKPHRRELIRRYLRDPQAATALVQEVVKFLPPPAQYQVGNG